MAKISVEAVQEVLDEIRGGAGVVVNDRHQLCRTGWEGSFEILRTVLVEPGDEEFWQCPNTNHLLPTNGLIRSRERIMESRLKGHPSP